MKLKGRIKMSRFARELKLVKVTKKGFVERFQEFNIFDKLSEDDRLEVEIDDKDGLVKGVYLPVGSYNELMLNYIHMNELVKSLVDDEENANDGKKDKR